MCKHNTKANRTHDRPPPRSLERARNYNTQIGSCRYRALHRRKYVRRGQRPLVYTCTPWLDPPAPRPPPYSPTHDQKHMRSTHVGCRAARAADLGGALILVPMYVNACFCVKTPTDCASSRLAMNTFMISGSDPTCEADVCLFFSLAFIQFIGVLSLSLVESYHHQRAAL